MRCLCKDCRDLADTEGPQKYPNNSEKFLGSKYAFNTRDLNK